MGWRRPGGSYPLGLPLLGSRATSAARSVGRRASLRAVAAAICVGLFASGLAAVFLPRDLRLAVHRGYWRGPTSGFRVSRAAPLLRGGRLARVRFDLGRTEPAVVVLSLSRRRPRNPVRVALLRDGTPYGDVALGPHPTSVRIPFRSMRDAIDIQLRAHSLRKDVPPAYFLHGVGLERRLDLTRGIAMALPLVVGWGLLGLFWPGTSPTKATLWALHGVAAAVVLLVIMWDPVARWQLLPQTWALLGLTGVGSLTALVATSVRRRGPGPSDEESEASIHGPASAPWFKRIPRRLASQWMTWVACLAVLPQLVVYAQHVHTGSYPGAVNGTRIRAMLDVSRAAVRGGPFVTVPLRGDRFSVAPGILNDLGLAAVVDGWSRFTGEPAETRVLGTINLLTLCAGAGGLILAWPPRYRVALAPALLLVPLSVREYASPDSVAIHGALAALAVAASLGALRRGPAAAAVPVGLALFALHKIRSIYGLYAVASLVISTVAIAFAHRRKRSLLRLVLPLVVFAVLGIPWQMAMETRATDVRLVDGETITSHNLWEPLISGVGWTENRWGIKPWDPWVAQFLADTLGVEPVPIPTEEGERRARLVYWSLWQEDASHMLWLYGVRIPRAFQDHLPLGRVGGALWLTTLGAALLVAWRRRNQEALGAVLAPGVLVACLVAQVVLIDPRPLYAYPLRPLAALSFAANVCVIWSIGGLSRAVRSTYRGFHRSSRGDVS